MEMEYYYTFIFVSILKETIYLFNVVRILLNLMKFNIGLNFQTNQMYSLFHLFTFKYSFG